jgi:hypothetical protein
LLPLHPSLVAVFLTAKLDHAQDQYRHAAIELGAAEAAVPSQDQFDLPATREIDDVEDPPMTGARLRAPSAISLRQLRSGEGGGAPLRRELRLAGLARRVTSDHASNGSQRRSTSRSRLIRTATAA